MNYLFSPIVIGVKNHNIPVINISKSLIDLLKMFLGNNLVYFWQQKLKSKRHEEYLQLYIDAMTLNLVLY